MAIQKYPLNQCTGLPRFARNDGPDTPENGGSRVGPDFSVLLW